MLDRAPLGDLDVDVPAWVSLELFATTLYMSKTERMTISDLIFLPLVTPMPLDVG